MKKNRKTALICSAAVCLPMSLSSGVIFAQKQTSPLDSTLLTLGESARSDPAAISTPQKFPSFTKVPPRDIFGFLGQTLLLSAKGLNTDLPPVGDEMFAWVLNGKLICAEMNCRIPLDGKTGSPGLTSLLLLVYNSRGSTLSKHSVSIYKGNWKPDFGMQEKFYKSIESVTFAEKTPPFVEADLHISAEDGAATLTVPESLKLIGLERVNTAWGGRLRTGSTTVAKLKEPGKADWFFLPKTEVFLENLSDKPTLKSLILKQGAVRLGLIRPATYSAIGKRSYTEDVRLATSEFNAVPESGADIFVFRIPPEPAGLRKRAIKNLGEPLAKDEQYQSRVVVISGSASVTLSKADTGASKVLNIPPGVELTVFEDGTVLPLKKPDRAQLEKLLAMTFSKKDLEEKLAAKIKLLKNVNLKEHIKKVEDLLEREDYFEALGELKAVEDREQEDHRIPYFIGVAHKGLYQTAEAEQYWRHAQALDSNYVPPLWALAQMRMEEKKWTEAKALLTEIEPKLQDTSELYPQFLYFSGVTNFNLGGDFSSRNAFTQALWEQGLDKALQSSSGNFLQTLSVRKPWLFIVPLGVQYDSNTFNLSKSAPLPPGYASRSVMRGIAGGIFTWDSSTDAKTPGMFLGAGAKLIYVKNLSANFSKLDALVSELSFSQVFKSRVGESNPKELAKLSTDYKLSEFVGFTSVGGKVATISIGATVNYQKLEAAATFEMDNNKTATLDKSTLNFRQEYGLNLMTDTKYSIDTQLRAQENYVLKSDNETNGHGLNLSAQPGITFPISPRFSVKVTLPVSAQWVFQTPRESTYQLGTGATASYFLTPWLMGSLGGNYDLILKNSNGAAHKPGASLMLTGIL